MRVSDAEREEAAERLRVAAGDGRLDLQELEERLEQTYAARTYGELEPLTLDLRGHEAACRGRANVAGHERGPRYELLR